MGHDNEVLERITNLVSNFSGVTVEELMSPSRKKHINTARQLAMFFMLMKTRATLKAVVNHFNREDHTTAINSRKKINDRVCTDGIFRLKYMALDMQIDKMFAELEKENSRDVK